MKKLLLLIFPILAAFVVFFIISSVFLRKPGKGTLQVTSQPTSTIYLDGKAIGRTPYPKSDVPPLYDAGDYTIRIVPDDTSLSPFEEKVTITASVLTVVDRTFGSGGTGEGSIIGFAPLEGARDAEILIVSFPDKAQVRLDEDLVGETPLLLKNVSESDHEVKLTRDGYRDKLVPIRTKIGYKLSATIFLGVLPNLDVLGTTATPSATVFVTPSVTPIIFTSTPTPTTLSQVKILQTPTGFLRVRESASLSSSEIAEVTPGEIFPLVSVVEGWYEIKLSDGRVGWISSSYAQKK